jgi:2-aminoethylphosphonate-pyruvate transaminase
MLLLIPGPVATAPAVKAALAHDFAPWDNDFRAFNARLLARVLAIAGGVPDQHVALPLQGCGHFITEAAVRTFVPPGAKLLVAMTGAYASRIERLATEAGRIVVKLPVARGTRVDPTAVAAALAADPTIRNLGVVYSETGSGVIHDVQAVGRVAHAAGVRMIVDGVSAFGALPFDIAEQPETDAIVFTANKCLEGVPGAAFAVARIDRLLACAGQAGSWSLDLADLYANTLRAGPGSSRFTPAPQVLNAFNTALDLYDAEGGQAPRLARYQANARTLYDGVKALGLTPWLSAEMQGPIVLNVHAPDDPAWHLQNFVDALKRRGVLISNFYNTETPTFRVGCIGAITPADMARAVDAIGGALEEIGIRPRKAA